jgi:hypothetical protein
LFGVDARTQKPLSQEDIELIEGGSIENMLLSQLVKENSR